MSLEQMCLEDLVVVDAAAAPASGGVAGVVAAASAVSASCARLVSSWSSNLRLTTLDLVQQLAP